MLDKMILAQLDNLSLGARRIGKSSSYGAMTSHRRGYSPEFSDYREYCSGDDPRFIDWNLFGRFDNLYLKLFLAEDDLHIRMFIDCSASMQDKFECMQQTIAALGYIALAAGNRLQVFTVYGGKTLSTAVLRNKKSVQLFFDFLARLKPEGQTSTGELAACARNLQTVGTGLHIMFSDFFPADFVGYKQELSRMICTLAGVRKNFHLIHILSQEELQPDLSQRHLYIDSESAEEIRIDAVGLIANYHMILDDYIGFIKKECLGRNGGYTMVNTRQPILKTITELCKTTGLLRYT